MLTCLLTRKQDTADALHVLGADGFPHHHEYKHKLAQLWKDFCKSSDAHAMHCDGALGHSAKRAVWELIHEEAHALTCRAPASHALTSHAPATQREPALAMHRSRSRGRTLPCTVAVATAQRNSRTPPTLPLRATASAPSPQASRHQVHAFPTAWYRIFPSMFTNAHEALQQLDPDKFVTPLDAIIRDFLRFRELHNPLAGYA